MKKEVQALINRRRARMVPAILGGIALIIVIAMVGLMAAVFSRGPGMDILRTATETVTQTDVPPTATATRVPDTPTPEATPTATDTPGPSPTPTEVVHVVQQGESLFSIAELYRANVCTMMAVNNIADASFLAVGQTLIIPGPDVELPTATPLPTGLPRGARLEYVVQCGDTLESIAAKFDSLGTDIATQNAVTDQTIRIGDTIIVRVNLATATPTQTPTNTQPAPEATETPGGEATPTPTP
jgi:LysM repeat protein